MRIVILFSPPFLAFEKALMKNLQMRYKNIEIIGLATTHQVYKKLCADTSLNFLHLESFESQEEEWINAHYSAKKLQALQTRYGVQIFNDLVISDRLVGRGFITCAKHLNTRLTQQINTQDGHITYMCELVSFVSKLYKKYKPDAAFVYAIAGANVKALFDILKHEGTKTFRIQTTRVDDLFILDSSAYGALDHIWNRINSKQKAQAKYRKKAKLWIDEFRKSENKKPGYFKFSASRTKQRLSLSGCAYNILYAFARMTLYPIIKGKKPLHAPSGWQQFCEAFSGPLQSHLFYRTTPFIDATELKKRPFILYTLHVDPEASTTLLSPDYTNQLAVIEALAKRKPFHMSLVVKEHPNMVGRRPAHFYKTIRNMPGVHLIHPNVPSQDLIKAAALVTTITGTVAWEAIMLKKPVIMFGEFPFSPLGGAIKTSFESLAEDITIALNKKPVSDTRLIDFLSVLFEESFSLDSRLMWTGIDDKTVKKQHQKTVNTITDHFVKNCIQAGLKFEDAL